MSVQVAFLQPTRIKLVFLAEWVFFVLIAATRGNLDTSRQILVAIYPLIFFYLAGCTLTALSQRIHQIAKYWWLLGVAISLAILDQAIKLIVAWRIPYQTYIPIVKGWLYLAHERNPQGSWIASVFNVQSTGVFYLLQISFAILVIFLSLLYHRYYIAYHRKSFWADIALLGLVSGYASWMSDMILHGYIIDFLKLPDLVTVDFKDFLVTIGVAALFAELLDNPEFTWRWAGWHKERDNLIHSSTNFFTFFTQELRDLWRVVESIIRR